MEAKRLLHAWHSPCLWLRLDGTRDGPRRLANAGTQLLPRRDVREAALPGRCRGGGDSPRRATTGGGRFSPCKSESSEVIKNDEGQFKAKGQ
jgi:hypothetical protein